MWEWKRTNSPGSAAVHVSIVYHDTRSVERIRCRFSSGWDNSLLKALRSSSGEANTNGIKSSTGPWLGKRSWPVGQNNSKRKRSDVELVQKTLLTWAVNTKSWNICGSILGGMFLLCFSCFFHCHVAITSQKVSLKFWIAKSNPVITNFGSLRSTTW